MLTLPNIPYAPDVIVTNEVTGGNGPNISDDTVTVATLSNIRRNKNSIAALAANVITLPAGSYKFDIEYPIVGSLTGNIFCWFDLFDGSTSLVKGLLRSPRITTANTENVIVTETLFVTVTSSTGFRVRFYKSAATYGITNGTYSVSAVNAGVSVYNRISITKVQ